MSLSSPFPRASHFPLSENGEEVFFAPSFFCRNDVSSSCFSSRFSFFPLRKWGGGFFCSPFFPNGVSSGYFIIYFMSSRKIKTENVFLALSHVHFFRERSRMVAFLSRLFERNDGVLLLPPNSAFFPSSPFRLFSFLPPFFKKAKVTCPTYVRHSCPPSFS